MTIYSKLVLGNSVTVARLALDQLVGVQIPVPQHEINSLPIQGEAFLCVS
jgi:hypothetical protein